MTYHEWADWVDPAHPVTGPKINWGKIDTFVFHYTAAINLPDGDFGEFLTDLPGYMRYIQREYLGRTPPYSIGYNEAADWLGGIWKARGFEIECAANKGHNDHTFAMLMLVDWQDPATDLCVAAVRARYGLACKRAGEARGADWEQLFQVGHQNLAPTGCPGIGVMEQIQESRFLISRDEYYDTPTPPPVQEDDMKIRIMQPIGSNAIFLAECTADLTSVNVRWSGPGDNPNVIPALKAHVQRGAVVNVDEGLAKTLGAVHNDPTKRPLVGDLLGCWLIGPLPVGDLVPWIAQNFAGVE